MNLVQPDPKKRPTYIEEVVISSISLSSSDRKRVESELSSGIFKPADIPGLKLWQKAGDLTVADNTGGVAYWGNKAERWHKRTFKYWRAKFKVWVESWPWD